MIRSLSDCLPDRQHSKFAAPKVLSPAPSPTARPWQSHPHRHGPPPRNSPRPTQFPCAPVCPVHKKSVCWSFFQNHRAHRAGITCRPFRDIRFTYPHFLGFQSPAHRDKIESLCPCRAQTVQIRRASCVSLALFLFVLYLSSYKTKQQTKAYA